MGEGFVFVFGPSGVPQWFVCNRSNSVLKAVRWNPVGEVLLPLPVIYCLSTCSNCSFESTPEFNRSLRSMPAYDKTDKIHKIASWCCS